MKRLFFILGIISVSVFIAHGQMIQLIPQPVEIRQTGGSLRLTGASVICFNKPEIRLIAENLAGKLSIPTGFNIKAKEGGNGTIQLLLNEVPDQKFGAEGYTLESGTRSVEIKANQPAGIYYGIQTLLQLLPKEIESRETIKADWIVPGVRVNDYPRFGWRGVMLDVSRLFFSKDDVKKFIDQSVMPFG